MRGSRALAAKAFGRVGDYANRKLSGMAIKAAVKSNVSDAVNHASLRGRHTDAITDPVRGIEQVTATVESSNDKIARTIEDINTELQKFLYKRKTTVKRRAVVAEEDEAKVDRKKKPVKPKIKPKPKVKPRAKYKPKSKFRPKPKNPLTKLKGKVPNNAVTKLGSGASTALSGASKLKGVAKAGKFGKALGVAGTAIGMAGEYAGEIADTGNHQRAAAAAAGTGAGMTIGGWAGGAAGAALGLAVGGPVGAAILGTMGYLGGSWGGGEVGAAGGRHAYDIAANNKARAGGAFNEHSVDLTDLEYNFSNIHFESRELIFEFAKITGANNLGSQSNGGRHTGLGPDADYSGGPNGDRGGLLFDPISGQAPDVDFPSTPRSAHHNDNNRPRRNDATAESRSDAGGTTAPPNAVIKKAEEIAINGGPGAVQEFMRSQGYPQTGPWCGQFAASVIKAAGGTPPKNPSIASNWRNYGVKTDNPQPGDIAIRKNSRFGGGYVPTGATGSHVTIYNGDGKNGSFIGLGGNQGKFRSNFNKNDFEFRTANKPEAPVAANSNKTETPVEEKPAATPEKKADAVRKPITEQEIEALKPKPEEPQKFANIGRMIDQANGDTMGGADHYKNLRRSDNIKDTRDSPTPSAGRQMLSNKLGMNFPLKFHSYLDLHERAKGIDESDAKPNRLSKDLGYMDLMKDDYAISDNHKNKLIQNWKALESINLEPQKEPERQTVDDQNVNQPPLAKNIHQKQSSMELNDRDDQRIYQSFTEYSNLSKVV